ncbi:MAG: LysM peptidoglycan-binding domain-containing protein [Bacteriovoracaceae bacterium]|nr:LysM peptidoglycan-binding domain-containing protein [Bacteriovoracaceae bacterium]
MKWLNLLLILSLITVTSCSNNKKKGGEDAEGESIEQDADFIVDSEDEDLMMEEGDEDDDEEISVADDEPISIDSGSNGQYTVKKGDTLMWIAFKIYGDYSKWQNISNANGGISTIRTGQVLSYNEPAEKFVWQPNGLPHTVVGGETLGTISNDKYGTSARWKSIFDNNQPMIQDANLIFAGFTLYYVPDRDIASE